MTDEELHELNAQVRDAMHGAASAVLGAMIRNLHRNTATRILLTNPPISSHIAGYTLLSGDQADVEAYGEVNGLKSVTADQLEVQS